ncbi:hypothetical protein GALMADRAFT_798532 [Galerina marginata CBS 339.88]|uniref:Uncharacterized protein n=1 Tax=Galerina marginata (strain CBS 339.88) TaxID=685588 RepID=A0A067SMP6_GALM3|nr:hypothetical protein GALMADRAFT_798532 [Galerina marginata CBS 339.88]
MQLRQALPKRAENQTPSTCRSKLQLSFNLNHLHSLIPFLACDDSQLYILLSRSNHAAHREGPRSSSPLHIALSNFSSSSSPFRVTSQLLRRSLSVVSAIIWGSTGDLRRTSPMMAFILSIGCTLTIAGIYADHALLLANITHQ